MVKNNRKQFENKFMGNLVVSVVTNVCLHWFTLELNFSSQFRSIHFAQRCRRWFDVIMMFSQFESWLHHCSSICCFFCHLASTSDIEKVVTFYFFNLIVNRTEIALEHQMAFIVLASWQRSNGNIDFQLLEIVDWVDLSAWASLPSVLQPSSIAEPFLNQNLRGTFSAFFDEVNY